MPLNYSILEEAGVDEESLRRVFTAEPRSNLETDEEKLENDRLVVVRKRFERLIESRITEQIAFTLRNYHFYSAVDLAWDSSPINKATVPLVLYAKKKISAKKCAEMLDDASCGEEYVLRDGANRAVDVTLPKLSEVKTNLIRSIVTRRVAAQANRFNNLWPFFKYEARHRNAATDLKSDLVNQRMDVMADQFNYRNLQTQIIRDMLLYGRSIIFPRCSWEREVQWRPTGVKSPGGGTPRKAEVKKEGVSFVLPHASRVYYDFRHPCSTLNSDTGCEYVGYWEVVRYGEIRNNPEFFNQKAIAYTHRVCGWLQDHANYFDQYYTNVVSPADENVLNLSSDNDPEANIGIYSPLIEDSAVFLADHFIKIVPNEMGIGDYPYPVWLHLKVANSRTVVYVEILPSMPCAVFEHNSSDNRLINLSMAMELMPCQDQLDNLYVQLVEEAKRDLYSVALLNTDIFPEGEDGQEAKEAFEEQMAGENFYAEPAMLATSFAKMKEMGVDPTADNIFQLIRSDRPANVQNLFQAIDRIWALAERMVALSPQEQGQVAPREVSATEVQIVATTTEAVYNYISDSIDSGRAAWKRIIFESFLSLGESRFELPTSHRYPMGLIQSLQLVPEDLEGEQFVTGDTDRYLIRGPTKVMDIAYNWNTRDGAERTSNQQAAQTLSTLYAQLLQSPIGQVMPISKHMEILNEIMRLTGSSIDLSDPELLQNNMPPPPPQQGGQPQQGQPQAGAPQMQLSGGTGPTPTGPDMAVPLI